MCFVINCTKTYKSEKKYLEFNTVLAFITPNVLVWIMFHMKQTNSVTVLVQRSSVRSSTEFIAAKQVHVAQARGLSV